MIKIDNLMKFKNLRLNRFKVRNSFLKQLIVFSMSIVIITIIIGYLLDIFFMSSFYTERKKKNLLQVKNNILILEREPLKLVEYIEYLQSEEGIQVTILSPNQEIKNKEGRQVLQNLGELESEVFHVVKVPKIANTQLVYKETLTDGRILIMRTSLSLINNYRSEMDIFNLITTIISIILSGAICYLFSKAFVKDIKTLNSSAQKISNLKFLDKIEINREDEIGELSRNIQIMSENLKESMENLHSFVSDASHELKTPITVINTSIQTLLKNRELDEKQVRKNYEIIVKEVQELNSLLENLLNLSKVKSLGYTLEERELSLKSLIALSLEKYEDLELEKDITIVNSIGDEKIYGDEKLLKLALDNIIQNALKYSPYGDRVYIYMEEGETSLQTRTLRVRNKLLSELSSSNMNNNENLWKPFVRDSSMKKIGIDGSGLGLSIVKKALQVAKKEFGIDLTDKQFIFWMKL